MKENAYMLMKMIGSEVCGEPLSFSALTEKEAEELYRFAGSHNMSHLVAAAITHNSLVEDKRVADFYRTEMYTEIYKSSRIQYALEQTCGVLEEEGIDYIPLKGSVIKNYYPEMWMRSSTDIDILVRKKDHQRATDVLVKRLGYSKRELLTHDITLITNEGQVIELHFDLVEESFLPVAGKLLKKAWDYASPVKEGSFRYSFCDAMFYFYHIAHMAKHFIDGGCGIRPFLDIHIMEKHHMFKTKETENLLSKGQLLKFAEYAERLSNVWFSGEQHCEVTQTMEEYVLGGGSFGNLWGKFISERRKGGNFGYFISHMFVPYKQLRSQYSILEKYPIMTPFYAIKRWWELVFGKRKEFRKKHFKDIKNSSGKKTKSYSNLWKSLEL